MPERMLRSHQPRRIASASRPHVNILIALVTACALVNAAIAFAPNGVLHLSHHGQCHGRTTPENDTATYGKRQPRSSNFGGHTRKAMLLRSGADNVAVTATNSNDDDNSNCTSMEKYTPSKNEIFRRRGMTAALFMTYFAVMGAKCALPSVLAQLTSELGLDFSGWAASPQSLMARQLTLATVAIASGKLLLGPVIDRYGGVASLITCLCGLLLCLSRISVASSFTSFAFCWILIDFMFSSCWAACIHAVHQSFPSDEWAKRIAMLAAAARMGNACAFFFFSAILDFCLGRYERSWRIVFGCSAALQLVPIALLSYFGTMQPNLGVINEKKTKPSIAKSLATLRRETQIPAFWLHLLSRSALMVFGSFLLFIPTLMTQAYGATSSQAAKVGSLFALGCLLSVTTGSQIYSNLSRRRKVVAIASLMGTATICALAQLAHMTGIHTMTTLISTCSLFLWGFCFAIPFYIPPSMYSLNRGGTDSSATIADVFDIGGFALLAFFNGYAAGIAHSSPKAWIPTFCILTACAATSAVSLSLAVYLE